MLNAPGNGVSKTDTYAGSIRRPVAPPDYSNGVPYQIDAEHCFAHRWIEFDFGKTSSYVDVIRRADDPGWEYQGGENLPAKTRTPSEPDHPHESVSGHDPNSASPILLYVTHNGYHLTSLEQAGCTQHSTSCRSRTHESGQNDNRTRRSASGACQDVCSAPCGPPIRGSVDRWLRPRADLR